MLGFSQASKSKLVLSAPTILTNPLNLLFIFDVMRFNIVKR